jgi:hypothetical protein
MGLAGSPKLGLGLARCSWMGLGMARYWFLAAQCRLGLS